MIWGILSWIMSGIALAGTIINAERNRVGFLFWLVSNIYMSVRFLVIGEYAQSVLFFIYFILAIRGIMVWGNKENKEKNDEQEYKNAKEKLDRLRDYVATYQDVDRSSYKL